MINISIVYIISYDFFIVFYFPINLTILNVIINIQY